MSQTSRDQVNRRRVRTQEKNSGDAFAPIGSIIQNNFEGPEGVKWELGLAGFCPGKMGFKLLGLGFGHWEWE